MYRTDLELLEVLRGGVHLEEARAVHVVIVLLDLVAALRVHPAVLDPGTRLPHCRDMMGTCCYLSAGHRPASFGGTYFITGLDADPAGPTRPPTFPWDVSASTSV